MRDAGINVKTWGQGWDAGRASQDEMIKIFSTSRINLNLTAAYDSYSSDNTESPTGKKRPWERFFGRLPFTRAKKAIPIGCSQSETQSVLDQPTASEPDGLAGHSTEQIKGRNFEVPGTGGFLLTQNVAHLEDYYELGKEVVCFHSTEEMIEKVRYYLTHEDERASIAEAGYQRTLRDHTYQQRFNDIFTHVGLVEHVTKTHGDQPVVVGRTQDVK
jgi:spore maturation protein CgeB